MAEVVDTIALDKTRSFNKFDKDAVTGSRVHGGLGGVDQLASCIYNKLLSLFTLDFTFTLPG